ncbi:MAG: hypothetical protein QOI30_3329, partial [Mycobacterium sp.]|nr:hypothetical protein [Mycobacterium sp.]
MKLLTNVTVGKIYLSLHNRGCNRQENVTAPAAGLLKRHNGVV